jgi:hypothetical protein
MTSYQCTRFTSGLALNCPEKLLAFYICAVSGTWTCIEYSQGYYISQPPNG